MKLLLSACLAVSFVAADAHAVFEPQGQTPASLQQPLPRKGHLGAQLGPISPEVRQARKLPEQGGVLINGIIPDATAQRAGLQPQDVLLSINGEKLQDVPHLTRLLGQIEPGRDFEVEIDRAGKTQTVKLTMLERPRDRGDNFEAIYGHVVSKGHRIRTIVTRPTKHEGKRPTILFIQGIGAFSMDFPLSAQTAYAQILRGFNDRGFATVRVDKPGLGDSEGGPFLEVDFERDVDSFRQALQSLDRYDFIDRDNVFIVGHSMGGCHAPILGSEIPVKGIAAIGTVTRKWQEYMFENTRRQRALAGQPHGQIDAVIQQQLAALHFLYNEKLSPEEAKKKYPQYEEGINMHSPDGRTMSGMPLTFWRQVFNTDFSAYWEKVDAHVIALWGENEFIASWADHPLIAEIVNRRHPGRGKYGIIPNSDHGFNKTESVEDSFKRWGQPGNEFNPNIIDILNKWIDEVLAGK